MASFATVPASVPAFRPLYRQIQDLIVQALADREWQPGEMIPSEMELAARFEVSQGTVRRAIDELASEHLLVRRQGKGTFVATHADPRAFFRFLRLIPDDGTVPRSRSEPLECQSLRAGQEVAKALAIKHGDPVLQLRRILRFDGQPVVVDEIYLPADLFPNLTLDQLRASDRSLYTLFESLFGVRMVRAEEKIRAVAADPVAAELLGIDTGTPLLSVERTAYTYGNRPAEWRRGLYSTLNHHYFNELG
ncbi:MAG: GntR family transcriptional regulator [Rhodocyclaceae bacterium]|jgi:GntR family transcriptional regulator|nr:GntR family transcriptional regulator [Rhodocyclaceae bacterium]